MNLDLVTNILEGVASAALTFAAREVWRAARRLVRALDDVSVTRVDVEAIARQLGTQSRAPGWGPLEHYLRERNPL